MLVGAAALDVPGSETVAFVLDMTQRKRAEEALRVLEEYSRILSPHTPKRVQALRFKVYEWETKLLSNGSRKHGSTS